MKTLAKLRRDNEVAVIYNDYYGAGWYTWHHDIDLLFDPAIAEWILSKDYDKIATYLTLKYPDVMAARRDISNLAVRWIPKDQEFFVIEYDGRESVVMKHEFQWITA